MKQNLKIVALASVSLMLILSCRKSNVQETKLPEAKVPETGKQPAGNDYAALKPGITIVKNLKTALSNPDFEARDGALLNKKSKIVRDKGAKQNTGLAPGMGYVLVENQYQRNIKVSLEVDSSVLTQPGIDVYELNDYSDALDWAIANFNTLIAGSNVRFTRVSSSSTSDIDVKLVNMDTSIYKWGGMAIVPFDGKPGFEMVINSGYNFNYRATRYKVTLMTHELGHTIGFMHTDLPPGYATMYPLGYPITYQVYNLVNASPSAPVASPSNPNPDPGSIMNGWAYGAWTQSSTTMTAGWPYAKGDGFSQEDLYAFEYVYPYIPHTYEWPGSGPGGMRSYIFGLDYVPDGATLVWELKNVVGGVETDMPVGTDYPSLQPVAGAPDSRALVWGTTQTANFYVRVLPKVSKLGVNINMKYDYLAPQGQYLNF
ncbi:MAG: hypothetical protein J7599_18795 [Niabella sp.]|nr:hypothetical protein [Niabella sp.]